MRTILTPHFTLEELTTTQVRGVDNTPNAAQRAALKRVCELGLEPIRKHFNAPVIVTSGFRSPKVNKAIGGSTSSQHCYGNAVDFGVVRHSYREVVEWLVTKSGIAYDQVIYEFGRWVHLGFCDSSKTPRKQALMIFAPGKYLPLDLKDARVSS